MKKKRQGADSKFLGNCPVCSAKFSSSKSSQIGEFEGVRTLYVECKKCSSSVVLGIVKNMPGVITTVGMLTDMKREDIERLDHMRPITADDVLEMHKYLEY